jgi:hypothetical protein
MSLSSKSTKFVLILQRGFLDTA